MAEFKDLINNFYIDSERNESFQPKELNIFTEKSSIKPDTGDSQLNVFRKLIDDQTATIIAFINFSVICSAVAVLGIITNTLIMIVLIKSRMKDVVNISLFSLALADHCGLLALIWMGLCYNPFFQSVDFNFLPNEVVYLTGGIPRLIFTRTTSWITAFITFERFLCITFPLKIKQYITPRRTHLVVLGIYIAMATSVCPLYFATYLDWTFQVGRNRSVIGLAFRENRQEIEEKTFSVGSFLTIGSFLCVILFSSLLTVSLSKRLKWRFLNGQGNTKISANISQTQSDMTRLQSLEKGKLDSKDAGAALGFKDSYDSSVKKRSEINGNKRKNLQSRDKGNIGLEKDKKIGKMVVLVGLIFIVCFLPSNLNQIAMVVEKEYNKNQQLDNLFTVAWSFGHIMEAANSSVNIFVYYSMSSRFRNTFDRLFFNKKLG